MRDRAVPDIVSGLRRHWIATVVDRGGLLALCALALYAALASPRIADGDSAEFAALGALGGRAHPSGYPLYVLWLRLWSWLPGATPAQTAALATAILGALAVVALSAACRAWGARPLAAAITAAIFGAAPVVLRYHSEAEVFALNHLVAALVLWLAAARGPLRGSWRTAALGLVGGLGLANHLTCALLAPVGLLGVVRGAREASGRAYLIAATGFALGLLPYGYLWIADGPASWGRVASVADIVAFVARRDYGGAGSFGADGQDVAWTTSVAACFATIARSWLWLLAPAGAAMLGVRIWRPAGEGSAAARASSSDPSLPVDLAARSDATVRAGETRWGWAALAASFVLAGPVLASRFNIDPHGLGRYVCERFHLLPALLLAVPVAALVDLGLDRIATGSSRPVLAAVLPPLGFLALAAAGWPALAAVHSPALELGAQNLLRSLPRGAVAVVIADDHCAGGRYLQLARGERADVALICSGLLPLGWYRDAWAARGIALPAAPGPALGDALLRTGRPVFVDPLLAGVVRAFASYPLGILRRVLPRSTAPPAAAEIAAANREVFAAFDLDYPRPGRDDGYAALAHQRYAGSWAAIARLLDAAGDRDGARDALALARQLLPIDDTRPAP